MISYSKENGLHLITMDEGSSTICPDWQQRMLDILDQVEANFAPAAKEEGALVKLLSSEQPFLVMQAARDLELRGNLSSKARQSVEATLKAWRGRKDTSLALFIRFSCESILGIKTEY